MTAQGSQKIYDFLAPRLNLYEPQLDQLVDGVAAATNRGMTAATERGRAIVKGGAAEVLNFVSWMRVAAAS